jgi:hypothetical protein
MGSAKGGGSAGGTYEYTWDVIFNFGIVDNPVTVTKAWIGGDLVNPATVQSWSTGLPAAVDLFQQGVADVKATETFFAPGYITGDANLESWPYFTSQGKRLGLRVALHVLHRLQRLAVGPVPCHPAAFRGSHAVRRGRGVELRSAVRHGHQ